MNEGSEYVSGFVVHLESSGRSLLLLTRQRQIASGWKAEAQMNKESEGGTLINEFGPTLCLPHPASRLRLRPPVYALFILPPTD